MKHFFYSWRNDIPSGLVVFLVALPLCLGVAMASTGDSQKLLPGIIAGVVGGIIVGFFSGSKLGVSGPAAGLITIVSGAIASIGSYEGFLLAIVVAGIIQFFAGLLGAGIIGNYFPSSVIKGMLAAIGLTLILKEVPHIVGYDKDYFGDESFIQIDGYNTFTDILNAMNAFSPGAFVIGLVSIVLLLIFEKAYFKKNPLFKIIPGALIVVVIGIILNTLFQSYFPKLTLNSEHLVNLQIITSFSDFGSVVTFPNFNEITNPKIYTFALTIALIASLETLLSLEATDKLDPTKHFTPTNKELKAQGLGNIVSGLLGGLPVTQVIVRSSANINAGAKSKLSTIFHGFLLLISAFIFPSIINLIPLSALAAILMLVGYKLSNIQLYKNMYRLGLEQFIPFISTIIGVLFTDLLKGIALGMALSLFYILRKNYRNNYEKTETFGDNRTIVNVSLSEEVSFLNKGGILEIFQNTQSESTLIIDGSKSKNIDYDVLEAIYEFKNNQAIEKNISIELINIPVLTN